MQALPHFISMFAALLIGACAQPAVKSSESLVGAEALPSAHDLSREIIQINRGFGQISEGFLSYELKADGKLVVTHEDRKVKKIVGTETFQLSGPVADQARHMLWRVRPARLEGIEQDARPLGCERQGPHDFGELAVVFINEGKNAGVDDDQVGIFELPSPDSCNTRHASESRRLLERVLKSFPASRVATEFPKAT